MRVRILRGTQEIGGSCVELEHDGARIVLDLGKPLTARRNEVVALPDVAGLTGEVDPSLLGIFVSHGHQDHWGLLPQVNASVPRYIGEGAADVLRAAQFWGSGIDLNETGHLAHREPIVVGPFTVTPFLNDHSAFDAYSLVVEAGHSRVFYTGDLRAHGRKGGIFEELVRKPPTGVDLMLCEGTNLHAGSSANVKPTVSEDDVEVGLAETLRTTEGLVVVISSPQNIDRTVTVYRAALKANRDTVIDLYTADIMAAAGRESLPQLSPEWPRVHLYVPLRQRVKVKETEEFDRVAAVKQYRLFPEALGANASNYVLVGSYQSDLRQLLKEPGLQIGAVVWSLWNGYLREPSGEQLIAMLEQRDIPLVHHHTSGHASSADLTRLIDVIDPRVLVPIHTEHPEGYEAIAGDRQVSPAVDGEWFHVGAGASLYSK